MSTDNCTNPKAVNYNPNATSNDGSCLYLESIGGVCYAFQDVAPSQILDMSFTLSWSLEAKNWVFFHDYTPDFYFSTREKLMNLKGGKVFRMNTGPNGLYHDPAPYSFLVDVVFTADKEITLNTVNWLSEVMNADGSESRFETLTHITIWNGQQCTGRIPLAEAFENLQYKETRRMQGRWSFNDFKDQVINPNQTFLQDVFHNFAVIGSNLDTQKPWFEQELMEDNWFIVRFEFDNSSGKKVYLHDTDSDANPSYR